MTFDINSTLFRDCCSLEQLRPAGLGELSKMLVDANSQLTLPRLSPRTFRVDIDVANLCGGSILSKGAPQLASTARATPTASTLQAAVGVKEPSFPIKGTSPGVDCVALIGPAAIRMRQAARQPPTCLSALRGLGN